MLSLNSKRQIFGPQRPRKLVIIGIAASVVLSITTGMMLYYNNQEGETSANNNVEYVNSAANIVEPENIVDKPIVGEPTGDEKAVDGPGGNGVGSNSPQNNVTKEYEVMIEDVYKKDGVKNAYLTFDDGPTKNITPQVLDILKSNNIKASFFVMGQMVDKSPEMLKRTYDEGHAICMHSYYHDYNNMYNSMEFFKEDLNLVIESLKTVLGENFSTRVYRFPGGSFGNSKEPYRQTLKDSGFFSLDWNTLNGDAETIKDNGKKRTRNAAELVERVKGSIVESGNPEDIVILMHDAATKQATVDSLPAVIEYLKSQGYNFKTLK